MASGRPEQLVQLFTATGGHCGFSAVEHLAAFFALTRWVEEGVEPTAAAVQATCTALKPFAGGGPCRVMAAAPGEWGLRVVERRERGAPLHELVCVGDPADCPSGSTCSPRHSCR